MSGRRGDTKVLADLPRQDIGDFSVAGHSRAAVLLGMVPP